jgi:hypothetical protein
METKIIGSSGKYTRNTASDSYPWFLNEQGAQLTAPIHGELTEACMAGRLFYAFNAGGVTSTAGVATTYVGICLSNPVGNNKKLILRAVGASIIVAPAAILQMLLIGGYVSTGGVSAHTTPLVIGTSMGSMRLGGAEVPTGLVDSAATIASPRILHNFGSAFMTTLTTMGPNWFNTFGAPVILPGGYVAPIGSVASGTAGFMGTLIWEEVDL